ncbi:hypothetical protein ABH931_004363 [Streptacidiphilus sp. MAP12-33]|uniref:hypothetical protein n=1 Tax=Streptacidiphilus sp. MAP12-33 TaxID=3156266 RepID=UPI00351284E9
MHDTSHSPMTPAEAASLRDASPVDEALLQRIRAALVGRNAGAATTDVPRADVPEAEPDDSGGGAEDGADSATGE